MLALASQLDLPLFPLAPAANPDHGRLPALHQPLIIESDRSPDQAGSPNDQRKVDLEVGEFPFNLTSDLDRFHNRSR